LEVAPGPLARDLDQSELGDRQHSKTRAVSRELRFEPIEDLPAVAEVEHVDEVDHQETAEIAQPDLARDLGNRLQVRGEHGLLVVDADRFEVSGDEIANRP